LLGGAAIFAKLPLKIAKSQKNLRKSLCAQLHIDSRNILMKFHCSGLGPRTWMCAYTKNFLHVAT